MGTFSRERRWPVLAAALLVAGWPVALLAGCVSSSESNSAATSSAMASTHSPEATSTGGDCGLRVSDAWVKAADSGMTAAFGVIANPGEAAVTISAATSPASASMELHEMATVDGESVMRPIAGGLDVPAGAAITLAPGGNHFMLIGLTAPIKPGDEVAITVQCATGGTFTMTALAKTFAGAQESYAPSASPTGN